LKLAPAALLPACADGGAPPGRAAVPSTSLSLGPAPAELASVQLSDVPHVRQKPDFCGEACVEMAARRLGKRYGQDDVFGVSGVDPALGRGATTRELAVAARALGFTIGDVWFTVRAAAPAEEIGAAFVAVVADLARGVPTIVCTRFDERPRTTEHFRLVVGYDQARDEVVYHEPAADDGAFLRMPRARLLSLWPLKYEADRWTLIRIPLAPAALVDPPAPRGFSRAQYAQHVMATRERLERAGIGGASFRIEEPFVVVGDDPPQTLRERSKTVRWAADMLEKDFFERRPRTLLSVFLFRDAKSYERGVAGLTGEAPSTPYGFYSRTDGGLFMNIATGGGTLVHEIVHPYVEADFDGAPAWLNEGLGSLFEQSGERNGRIVGYTNWRLAGLQRAIKQGGLPSFRALCAMTDHEFYEEDRGTNYAQSRYLMYYLQEQDLLATFYRAFRAAKATDRTGYATLVRTLGESDMVQFQRRWEGFVLGLRFP
jgi:hypothetical protein